MLSRWFDSTNPRHVLLAQRTAQQPPKLQVAGSNPAENTVQGTEASGLATLDELLEEQAGLFPGLALFDKCDLVCANCHREQHSTTLHP